MDFALGENESMAVARVEFYFEAERKKAQLHGVNLGQNRKS